MSDSLLTPAYWALRWTFDGTWCAGRHPCHANITWTKRRARRWQFESLEEARQAAKLWPGETTIYRVYDTRDER